MSTNMSTNNTTEADHYNKYDNAIEFFAEFPIEEFASRYKISNKGYIFSLKTKKN